MTKFKVETRAGLVWIGLSADSNLASLKVDFSKGKQPTVGLTVAEARELASLLVKHVALIEANLPQAPKDTNVEEIRDQLEGYNISVT